MLLLYAHRKRISTSVHWQTQICGWDSKCCSNSG